MRPKVRACLACGSADLRSPSVDDGVTVGSAVNLGLWVCDACGWSGVPLEFDDEGARRSFVAGLHEGAAEV